MDPELILALEKYADIPDDWTDDPNHRGSRIMAFGVTSRSDGSRIQGVHVELASTASARTGLRKFAFGLYQLQPGHAAARIYMLEVGPPENCRHRNHDGTWISGPHVVSMLGTQGPFPELLGQPFGVLFQRFCSAIRLATSSQPDDPFELRLR
jgi:hypothetical protein